VRARSLAWVVIAMLGIAADIRSPEAAVSVPAVVGLGPGMRFDFEFVPTSTGELFAPLRYDQPDRRASYGNPDERSDPSTVSGSQKDEDAVAVDAAACAGRGSSPESTANRER
jgi:hypothetical protein